MNEHNSFINENTDSDILYHSTLTHTTPIEWSHQHEKILIEWADKATCYKWLHEKTHQELSSKNRWFTIPVIIMSTLTGTANFAQERVPPEYVNVFTMGIGTISLVAGIITTVQQFLKISELNESHRVSSISWGKFYRNIKVELAKSPIERTPVTQMIKTSKEEFDRLIETSYAIPNHIIQLFKETFSGGEIKYDQNGNKYPLTDKQKLYDELTKPEICDSLESVSNIIYKVDPIIEKKVSNDFKTIYNDSKIQLRREKKEKLELFIHSFEKEKKRLPTLEEIKDNIEDTISIDSELIQSVITDIDCKSIQSEIGSSSV
jgi:hypothetical protein